VVVLVLVDSLHQLEQTQLFKMEDSQLNLAQMENLL